MTRIVFKPREGKTFDKDIYKLRDIKQVEAVIREYFELPEEHLQLYLKAHIQQIEFERSRRKPPVKQSQVKQRRVNTKIVVKKLPKMSAGPGSSQAQAGGGGGAAPPPQLCRGIVKQVWFYFKTSHI